MTCHSCKCQCKRFGRHRNGLQRYRCRQCKKTFTEEHEKAIGPLDEMRLAPDRAVAVLRILQLLPSSPDLEGDSGDGAGIDGSRLDGRGVARRMMACNQRKEIKMLDAALEPILAYWIACPKCGERILLPRQSPLGRFEYPEHPSSDRLIADFLCLRCENGFSHPKVRSGPIQAQILYSSYLVEVPYRRAHSNSEVQKAVYIGFSPVSARLDALEKAKEFLRLNYRAEVGEPRKHLW